MPVRLEEVGGVAERLTVAGERLGDLVRAVVAEGAAPRACLRRRQLLACDLVPY